MHTAAYHPLPDILLSAFPSFSGGGFSDILLFRIVSVNPHRRASSDHSFIVGPLVALGWLVAALFHFDSNGMGGRDKIVVLRGAFHGDPVIPLAQALKLARKTLLILTVHVHMGMRSGDVIIIFDPSSIGGLSADLSSAKTGAPLRQLANAIPNPMNPIRPITCIATSCLNQLNGYCSYHTLRDILPSDYQPFSGGKYWGILLFRIVPVNPHRCASSDHEYKWSLQARSFHSPGNGTSVGPTAAVERGPSQGARSGSTGPTWVSFPPSLSLRYMVR